MTFQAKWYSRQYGIPGNMAFQAIWYFRQYGIPGNIVFQAIWYSRQYSIPGNMVCQAIWYSRQYDIPGNMVFQAIWYSRQYGIPGKMVIPGLSQAMPCHAWWCDIYTEGTWFKKNSFFLNGMALTPPLLALLKLFFAASLMADNFGQEFHMVIV